MTVRVAVPTCSTPDLEAPVRFCSHEYPTELVPVPDVTDGDSHAALLLADHGQPAVVVTVTVALPAGPAIDRCVSERLYEQLAVPCCVIVSAAPPIESVPIRGSGPVCCAHVYETAWLPVPEDWVGTSHGTSVVAVHAQPDVVVSVTDPEPAAAPTEAAVWDS
jgi:hypothetical protein